MGIINLNDGTAVSKTNPMPVEITDSDISIKDPINNNKVSVNSDGSINSFVTLTGSKVCLSTEEKPAGQQGDTLLEYNTTTKEKKVYKYISGDWREL